MSTPEVPKIPTQDPQEASKPPQTTQAQESLLDPPMEEPIEEEHFSGKVCASCLSDNLLRVVGIVNCPRCKTAFCLHFTSKIDPQYCLECMSDLSVTKEIVRKEYEFYNETTDKTTKYARRARRIQLEGLDWLFAQRKIPSMSDAELDMAIEYHRVYCNLLLIEAEKRRTEKMHRYANVKVVIPAEGTSTVTKTTTTKKTKTTSSTKAQALMSTMFEQLLKQGKSVDEIIKMLGGS